MRHAPNVCIQPYIIIYKLRLLKLHHHYTCMQFMKATKIYIYDSNGDTKKLEISEK